jgi:hypothetical protein
MFTDTYYKFSNEQEAIDKLTLAGLVTEDEGVLNYGDKYHSISIVGLIVDEPGTYDEEGNQLTAPTFIDGWHVNIRSRGDAPTQLAGYKVTPNTPSRVWA